MPVKPQRHYFVKGPLPLWWITRAVPLPSQALAVGLAIWFWAGMRRSHTVRLSLGQVFPDLQISRFTAYRALRALEAAQLVRVERRPGHPPIVTLVRTPPRRTGIGGAGRGRR